MIDITTRKIQQQKNAYLISLPIRWVRHMQLENHQEVAVAVNEKNELVIKPASKKPNETNNLQ